GVATAYWDCRPLRGQSLLGPRGSTGRDRPRTGTVPKTVLGSPPPNGTDPCGVSPCFVREARREGTVPERGPSQKPFWGRHRLMGQTPAGSVPAWPLRGQSLLPDSARV